jgi:hypothetical protein
MTKQANPARDVSRRALAVAGGDVDNDDDRMRVVGMYRVWRQREESLERG